MAEHGAQIAKVSIRRRRGNNELQTLILLQAAVQIPAGNTIIFLCVTEYAHFETDSAGSTHVRQGEAAEHKTASAATQSLASSSNLTTYGVEQLGAQAQSVGQPIAVLARPKLLSPCTGYFLPAHRYVRFSSLWFALEKSRSASGESLAGIHNR